MALQYRNITGGSEQVLVAKRNVSNTTTGGVDITFDSRKIKNIILCNKNATDAVSIDLWIKQYTLDGTDVSFDEEGFYILNNVAVPNGATLVLDSSDGIAFNNNTEGRVSRELRVQLSASDSAVDIIIK